MLLNNFFSALKAGYGQFAAGSEVWQSVGNVATSMDGVSNNGWYYAYSRDDIFNQIKYLLGISGDSSAKSNARIRIAVGAGNTDPAPTDYTLTDACISATIQPSNYAKNDDGKLTGSAIVTNRGSDAIVYREIGVVLYGQFAVSSSSRPYKNLLLSRELLTSPITLQPGESATVTVVFDWS